MSEFKAVTYDAPSNGHADPVVEKAVASLDTKAAKPGVLSVRGDLENFNMAKWLWGSYQANKQDRRIEYFAPYEKAVYDFELQQKLAKFNGNVQKAQSELVGQDGGFLAPELWAAQFSDIIRHDSIMRKLLPIQYLSTTARVQHIPVPTSDWAWNYLSNNAAVTNTDIKFSQRTFTMHKCVALRQFSYELFQDASDLAGLFLQNSAASSIAFEQDKKILMGNGQSGTPTGVYSETNVGSANINATPTPVQVGTGVFAAKNLNASTNVPVGSTVNVQAVTAPRFENTVRNMINLANQGTEPWLFGLGTTDITRYFGVDWILTNAVPINIGTGSVQSHLFLGDWRHVICLTRNDIAWALGPSIGAGAANLTGVNTGGVNWMQNQWAPSYPLESAGVISAIPDFSSAMVDVKLVFQYDVAILHPEAFYVLQNISA